MFTPSLLIPGRILRGHEVRFTNHESLVDEAYLPLALVRLLMHSVDANGIGKFMTITQSVNQQRQRVTVSWRHIDTFVALPPGSFEHFSVAGWCFDKGWAELHDTFVVRFPEPIGYANDRKEHFRVLHRNTPAFI
jgi:hypothetical protein